MSVYCSLERRQLEFKVPNLVRSLESIIDCWGAKEFARCVLYLTGTPNPDLPYSIVINTEQVLQDLYRFRNDCSHGKPFGYSYYKASGKPPDGATVEKYEFLAVRAARKILNDAFTNETIVNASVDRECPRGCMEKWRYKVTT